MLSLLIQEERRVAKEEFTREEKLKMETKQKEEERIKSVTLVVVSAGYCKRTPPTMKQIKSYLNCSGIYSPVQKEQINKLDSFCSF